MDRYKGMEEYGEAKKQIYLYQHAGDWAVLNGEDGVVSSWAREAPAGVAWFGMGAPTAGEIGVRVRDGGFYWYEPSGDVTRIAGTEEVQVPGEHNLVNAACAATMALLAGAPVSAVRAGLASFRGVADRLELLRVIDGVRFYNDTTSTTPDSTMAAINSVEGPLVLIAGGAAKGLDFAGVSRLAAEKTLGVALLEGTATEKMAGQMREAGARVLGRFESFEEAVQVARRAVPVGGAVLLSPATASFGMFQNEFHRGERFREIVASLMSEG
jgi:UDP-N-acetylmuramoylalanine--D-glutamate ligase